MTATPPPAQQPNNGASDPAYVAITRRVNSCFRINLCTSAFICGSFVFSGKMRDQRASRAAARAAWVSAVISAQFPAATSAFSTIHEPPIAATIGSLR